MMAAEQNELNANSFRKPRIGESLIIIGALVLPICIGYIILGYPITLMLLTSGCIAGLMSMRLGWRWKQIENAIANCLRGALPAIFIMYIVGMVIGTFMYSGTIPMIIYYGIQIINPRFLVACSFLICTILSIATGTSWGSAGTAGIALMGIAIGLDVPLPVILGAVVAGSIIGDKISPLSDSSNIAAMATGVYIYDHIKGMLWTTIPASLIALTVYTVYGILHFPSGTVHSENILLMLEQLDLIYDWNPLLMLPFIIIIGGALKKFAAVPCMIAASVVSVLLGVLIQDFSLFDGVASMVTGFNISMANSPEFNSVIALPDIVKLLNRGGIHSMFNTVFIVICAYTYAGVAQDAGYFDTLINSIIDKLTTRGSTVLAAVLSGTFLTFFGGIGYVPSIIVGTAFKKPYLRQNLQLRDLARACEDTSTMIISIVPWCSSGVYYHSIFGVSTLVFAPWVILPFVTPLLAIFYGYTGIGMHYLTPEEAERQLAELEAEEAV